MSSALKRRQIVYLRCNEAVLEDVVVELVRGLTGVVLSLQVVSAASIAAKVTRDRVISDWKWESSALDLPTDFGSGYPSDPKYVACVSVVNVVGLALNGHVLWQNKDMVGKPYGRSTHVSKHHSLQLGHCRTVL